MTTFMRSRFLAAPQGGGGGGQAPLHLFFNSLEAGMNGSNPNFRLTDDFSRGFYFITTANPVIGNAGWNGTPFGSPDPQGTNFGRAGAGVNGGWCVSNGGHSGIGQAAAMADHEFSAVAMEIYCRFMIKCQADCRYGQEKGFTWNRGPAGVGGIFFGSMFYGGSGSSISVEPHFYSINQDANLGQNQGNDLAVGPNVAGGPWFMMEWHLKLNGNGSDLVEMFGDPCGATGMTHPASPTLRLRYTNASLRPGGDSTSTFRSVWWENWANPASQGEMLQDQLSVSITGPIGFPATAA